MLCAANFVVGRESVQKRIDRPSAVSVRLILLEVAIRFNAPMCYTAYVVLSRETSAADNGCG